MPAWDPPIQVFDERGVKAAMIAYFTANQVEALKWANGGASGLDAIKDFFKSPRKTTRFPALTIMQTSYKSRYVEENLFIDFSLIVEVAISHGNQNTLTDRSPKYSMAIESMLANMPETTFSTPSIIPITVTIDDLETAFDVQGKLKNNSFIQVFQTKVSWSIDASAE